MIMVSGMMFNKEGYPVGEIQKGTLIVNKTYLKETEGYRLKYDKDIDIYKEDEPLAEWLKKNKPHIVEWSLKVENAYIPVGEQKIAQNIDNPVTLRLISKSGKKYFGKAIVDSVTELGKAKQGYTYLISMRGTGFLTESEK
ncbi:MAG TPA: hypothetical protein VIK63_02480 [Haloplasmataceae bacterium]